MSQSDTKSFRKLIPGLDPADIISIMERLHAAAASGQLKMSASTDPQAKQAIFEATIGLLEQDRAKLDVVLGTLKEWLNGVHSGTAPSSSAPVVPNGLDAPSPNLKAPDDAPPPNATAPTQAVSAGVGAAPIPYYSCDTCGLWVKPGVSHTCTAEGRADDCFNGFFDEELDIIHGPDGWGEIDPPNTPKPESVDASSSDPEVPDEEEVEPEEEEPESLEHLLRPNSKLEKVYTMAKRLIEENGPTHLDSMIEPATKERLFLGVTNRRANLANFLSKLKGRGLLISDNRGFWSLPNGKSDHEI